MTVSKDAENEMDIRVFPAVGEHELDDSGVRSLTFARGYAVTRGAAPGPGEHWKSTELAGFTLAWDTRNPVVVARSAGKAVAIVGRCFDLDAATGEPRSVAGRLLRALTNSREALDEALYGLAGRYVVMLADASRLALETDATGMKAVYYAAGGEVAASHARLAAELSGSLASGPFGDSGWFGRTKAFTFPGNSTEYRDVRLLTPNTRLDLTDGSVLRVHPKVAPLTLTADEAARRILPLMRMQMEWLTQISKPQVSLTAGLDSRVTLAATHPYRDRCHYFSYATAHGPSAASTRQDLDFAASLAKEEKLRHQAVLVGEGPPAELAKVMAMNSRRVHARHVAAAYREQLPSGGIHIRSNIYEIGRAFYHHGSQRSLPELNPQRMAQLLVRKGADPSPEIEDAFRDWTDAVDFSGLPEGYDPHDIFYWEIRMGSWMQAVLQESDIAHDTYTLVNSRRVIDLLLSPTKHDRVRGRLSEHVLFLGWPELAAYPVNGRVIGRRQ